MENGTTVLEHFSNWQRLSLLHKDDDVNDSIRMMPKYTKFLIISMAGSFTDIHFDFSRCFITYSKDRNMENLNKFMRLRKNRKPESKRKPKWIPSMMSDKWQRLVINAGETTFIPGRHPHFVYTPVDSFVIGGNFLMEKDYPENPTEYDDDRTRSHMFQGFRSTMWAYLEHMLLPRLRAPGNERMVSGTEEK